jgi:hypothetical protein
VSVDELFKGRHFDREIIIRFCIATSFLAAFAIVSLAFERLFNAATTVSGVAGFGVLTR